MSAPGEVEFFADDGTPVAAFDEDAIDFGQNPVSRWAVVVMSLLVAAVVGALITQPPEKQAAAPPPEPVVSVASPTTTSGLGNPIQIDQPSPVIKLAVSAPLFMMEPGHLYRITTGTAFGVSLDGPGFTRLGTAARLVLDVAADRVWVVDGIGGGIVEFDGRNLQRLRTMNSNEPIRDAAALGGHLYRARARGLADIAPGADRPRIIAGVSGYIASVAADPRRARLLALVLSKGATIRQVTVAGTVLGEQASVPVGGGMLRVTGDGTIWIAGFGSAIDGAVVVRLDATTLRPRLGSPVAGRLGPSSWIDAAGEHDVWIRSGGDGEGLWCVDGRSGSILQYWPRVHGAVSSRDGAAFVLSEGVLVPLVLQRCAG